MADLTISPENDSLKEPELVSINTPTPLSHTTPAKVYPHIYVVLSQAIARQPVSSRAGRRSGLSIKDAGLYNWEHWPKKFQMSSMLLGALWLFLQGMFCIVLLQFELGHARVSQSRTAGNCARQASAITPRALKVPQLYPE